MTGNVNVTADLIASAKNYLDLTWADEAEAEKLTGILARGEVFLNHVAGTQLDYETEGTVARGLLFDYARYVLSNSLQDFTTDFAGELLGLFRSGEVEQYEATIAENTTL